MPDKPTKRSMTGPASSAHDEQVDVLDRFLAPPQTAARLDTADSLHVAQRPQQLRRHGLRLVDANAVGRRLEESDAFEDLLLRFLAEALEPGDPTRLACGLELLEIVHAELVVERLDLLRSQAANAQHEMQARRRFLAEVLVERQLASRDERR